MTEKISKLRAFREFAAKAWRLSTPYFHSEQKWRARGLLLAIVLLNLGAVYMLVQINEWNRVFYDALQNKDAAVFWRELGRFTYLAFGFIVIAVYRFYLTQLLEMRWRSWMTRHYLDRWLAQQRFYQMELARYARGENAPPDNPDQRLAEDMNLFTSYTVGLSMGLLNAVVTLVSIDPLRLRLTVPGVQAGQVSVGQTVVASVDAYPGRTFTGKVTALNPSLAAESRSLALEARVPNRDGALKPGAFATARIEQATSTPGLLVPAAAVRTVSGTSRVFVVADGRAEERLVTTSQGVGDLIEVTTGLKTGEQVATTNLTQLVDGVAVSVSK